MLCWRISLESDLRKISRKFSIKGEEGNYLVSISIGGYFRGKISINLSAKCVLEGVVLVLHT